MISGAGFLYTRTSRTSQPSTSVPVHSYSSPGFAFTEMNASPTDHSTSSGPVRENGLGESTAGPSGTVGGRTVREDTRPHLSPLPDSRICTQLSPGRLHVCARAHTHTHTHSHTLALEPAEGWAKGRVLPQRPWGSDCRLPVLRLGSLRFLLPLRLPNRFMGSWGRHGSRARRACQDSRGQRQPRVAGGQEGRRMGWQTWGQRAQRCRLRVPATAWGPPAKAGGVA